MRDMGIYSIGIHKLRYTDILLAYFLGINPLLCCNKIEMLEFIFRTTKNEKINYLIYCSLQNMHEINFMKNVFIYCIHNLESQNIKYEKEINNLTDKWVTKFSPNLITCIMTLAPPSPHHR